MNKRNIVAFIHTYQSDGNLDPYMLSVIHAFKQIGLNVYVVRTNDIVHHLGSTKLLPGSKINALVDWINELGPAFIFSTNRGGISQEIMAGTSCPIITRMVDLVPFYHQGGAENSLFCERDIVFVPTLETVLAFEKKFPVLDGKIHYLPFATDPDAFDAIRAVEKDIQISFVGTFFYSELVRKMIAELQGDPVKRSLLMRLMHDIKKNFHVHFDTLDYADGIAELCHYFEIDAEALRMQISNIMAVNSRVHYLDAVSGLGLKLYGTSNWIDILPYSFDLLDCFQFDEVINSREKLLHIYQRSKIALNIPHHQAGAGMPYRVYDIMASSALLITEYHAESELFDLFGKDVPIPMYRDAKELCKLTQYYLDHEDERLAIVQKCNVLIREKETTFTARAREYCSAVGLELNFDETGKLRHIKYKAGDWCEVDEVDEVDEVYWLLFKKRIYVLLSWILPYGLFMRWNIGSRMPSMVAASKTSGLSRSKPFLRFVAKVLLWLLPYRVQILLKQLIKGVQ